MAGKLKLAPSVGIVDPAAVIAHDAQAGGLGIDWQREPDGMGPAAVEVWRHLAVTFADDATRFREADRTAISSYAMAVEMQAAAGDALREHGVLVEGRSSPDAGRPVRSPAWAMWRDATTAVRQWSDVLGLTPSARARMRVPDLAPSSANNPFADGA